jgi:peroxiredoxin
MAFTGVCTQEFCEISAGLGAYSDLNCKVLGISGDNPFAQAAWAEKEGISLKLLSDYDHKATEAYGIAYDQFLPEKNLIMGGVPKRSAFLIDKAGVVQYAQVNESPGDLPDFEAQRTFLILFPKIQSRSPLTEERAFFCPQAHSAAVKSTSKKSLITSR